MTLLICRTCPRYDRRATGQFARDLTDAIRADGRDIPTRNVQCLGGCPDDSVIAVDGPSMTRVRFTGITSDDAPAIINATLAHQVSSTGNPGDWLIPSELTNRISSVTVKRQITAPGQASEQSQASRRHHPPTVTSHGLLDRDALDSGFRVDDNRRVIEAANEEPAEPPRSR
jgi:predicted metal-binding protein